jgi:hypothetical protein
VEYQQHHGQQAGWHHMQVRFPKDAVMHICKQLELPQYHGAHLILYLDFVLLHAPYYLKEKNENIHRLNSLANMDGSFELWGRWSQIIILTTLRILVPCIYFKHSYKGMI